MESSDSSRVELPDCIWGYALSIRDYFLMNVVLRGSSSKPNAFNRMALNPLTSLYCQNCVMLDSAGQYSPIDWPGLFSSGISSIRFTGLNITQLPASLPSAVHTFTLNWCAVTGTIPPNFLGTPTDTSFMLDLSNNGLSGTIPPSLFANLNGATLQSLTFRASGNQFTEVPGPLSFPALQALKTTFILDLSDNQIVSPIESLLPSSLFAGMPAGLDFQVALSNNKFTGGVPTLWFSICLNASKCTVSLDKNLLTGTLPERLFPLTLTAPFFRLTELTIDMSNNTLTGDVPIGFLDLLNINTSASVSRWDISLRNNQLDGSIASDIFALNWDRVNAASFDFSSNRLIGNLPSSILGGASAQSLNRLNIDVSNNPTLSGTIPSSLLDSLSPDDPGALLPNCALYLVLRDTGITGTINFPSLGIRSQMLFLTFDAANANLTSISFDDYASQYLYVLDVTNNAKLNGTLPNFLFNASARLEVLFADNTSLHGALPDLGSLGASHLAKLRLGNTPLDFCLGSRSPWTLNTGTFFSECDLIGTSAESCKTYYPELCFPAPPIAPLATPSVVLPPPTGCLASTRPSPEFVCIANTWTFIGTVATPVLTLPAGSTSTVLGNVTSPSIVITGLQSTLVVEGCVTNLSTVTVVLTPEELEKIGSGSTTVPLIYYNSSDTSCTSNLDGVKIVPLVKGSTCRKVVARPQQSSGSLSALFTVDSGKCKVWWIVLVSVICAVVIIAAVIIAAVVTYLKAAKHREYQKQLQG